MAFLQVENISENDAEFGGKKIYGVSEMRLGAFSDAHSSASLTRQASHYIYVVNKI